MKVTQSSLSPALSISISLMIVITPLTGIDSLTSTVDSDFSDVIWWIELNRLFLISYQYHEVTFVHVFVWL